MATFRYLGCIGIKIERSDGFKITVDPYVKEYEMASDDVSTLYDTDLILVTHAAFDHFGDTIDILRHSRAVLAAGDEVLALAKEALPDIDPNRLQGTIYGGILQFGQTIIRTVPAWHCSAVMKNGVRLNYNPFGYVIQLEEGITYHTGDTFIFSDMELIGKLYHPNVMIVGISNSIRGYSAEMTPDEAALAVEMVAPDVVIPSHYLAGDSALDMFVHNVSIRAPQTKIVSDIGRTFTYIPSKVILSES